MKLITILMVPLLLLIAVLTAGASEINCDQNAAAKVFAMLGEMATRQVKNGCLIYRWGNDWNHWNESQRTQMIKVAADADACLTGSARNIKFYSPQGVLVGEASPQGGIRRLK